MGPLHFRERHRALRRRWTDHVLCRSARRFAGEGAAVPRALLADGVEQRARRVRRTMLVDARRARLETHAVGLAPRPSTTWGAHLISSAPPQVSPTLATGFEGQRGVDQQRAHAGDDHAERYEPPLPARAADSRGGAPPPVLLRRSAATPSARSYRVRLRFADVVHWRGLSPAIVRVKSSRDVAGDALPCANVRTNRIMDVLRRADLGVRTDRIRGARRRRSGRDRAPMRSRCRMRSWHRTSSS